MDGHVRKVDALHEWVASTINLEVSELLVEARGEHEAVHVGMKPQGLDDSRAWLRCVCIAQARDADEARWEALPRRVAAGPSIRAGKRRGARLEMLPRQKLRVRLAAPPLYGLIETGRYNTPSAYRFRVLLVALDDIRPSRPWEHAHVVRPQPPLVLCAGHDTLLQALPKLPKPSGSIRDIHLKFLFLFVHPRGLFDLVVRVTVAIFVVRFAHPPQDVCIAGTVLHNEHVECTIPAVDASLT